MPSGPRPLFRRAIWIYLGTIVLPVGALIWLGLQSFDRQRQALATLTAEKLETAVESSTMSAAGAAFSDRSHPIVRYFFVIEDEVVRTPALHGPPPREAPREFAEAERQEIDLNRPDLALASYRRLLGRPDFEPLARSRVARVLSKLGRTEEAGRTWHDLAARYPDERDLSGRPYGIVAALNASDTAGLAERIASGRWELSRDQADYFLSRLPSTPLSTEYLDRFRFAQELTDHFRPPQAPRDGEVDSYVFGTRRILYKADGADRILGFLVNPAWTAALRDRLTQQLGIADGRNQDIWMYAGALTVVLLVLCAGVGLLWRDVSREASLNRLRAEFVSGVSHELKTPITLVRLYGETLLRHGALDEGQRREFYRIITRESARLGRLVEQVLTFSRVERGSEQYDLQEGDIAPVIAGVVDDYGEWLEQAGFHVTRAIPIEAPAVRFDPAAVSQAVVNLLDNAAKYSGSARAISVRLNCRERWLEFEVEDHGVGIAAADRQRVFDRFFRAQNGTGKGGHGLGLFMVRHIMEAHGGRAEVDSETGRGSTFRLAFPVVP